MTTKKPTKPTPLKQYWEQNREGEQGYARLSHKIALAPIDIMPCAIEKMFKVLQAEKHLSHGGEGVPSIGFDHQYPYNVIFLLKFDGDKPVVTLDTVEVL
jgi:hypothetical protein